MARKDLKYVTFTDFTQGIYSKYAASTQLGKDGSAQESYVGRYTYGCYGDPDGGLRPGPRFFKTFVTDFIEQGFTPTEYGNPWNLNPPEGGQVAIVDFTLVSPFYATTQEDTFGDDGSWPNQNDNSWEESGFTKSYPEAARDTPDMLFALTSHRFTNFGEFDKDQWTEDAADGSWHSEDGALVGQFKQWTVSRMPDGETDLSVVETPLQCRVAAAEWGGYTQWNQYHNDRDVIGEETWGDSWPDQSLPADRNVAHLIGRVNWAATDTDSWHGGTIAVGRSQRAMTYEEGDLLRIEDRKYPGRVAVAACLMHGVGWGANGRGLVGFPNFFSVKGVNADHLPDPEAAAPYRLQSSQTAFPNQDWKQAVWTWSQIPRYIIEHQDRIVGIISEDGMGGASTYLTDRFSPDGPGRNYGDNLYSEPNEWVRFSLPNLFVTPDFNSWYVIPGGGGSVAGSDLKDKQNIWGRFDEDEPVTSSFGNKNPSNYGVMISWAGELLLVKHRGGGNLVRGSIDGGQTIPLPNVASTNGLNCIPAYTELGAVYGTADGAAMWAGGSETKNVSPQLNGWFWNVGEASGVSRFNTGRRKNAIAGRFSYSYPFVYAPNNWMMDTRTGGWFRLANPVDDTNPYKHMFYSVNSFGKVYACRGVYDEDNLDVIDIYDSYEQTSEYQWVSQPVIQSMLNEVEAADIILTAQGSGTVTVILTGIDGEEQEEVFEIASSDRPYRVAKNTSVTASELVVTIRSEGANVGDAQEPAPVVHMLSIGLNETTGLMRV